MHPLRSGPARRPAGLVPRVLLAVLLGAGLLAGCGAGDPERIGARGVDGLVVPTPSPDPADFVDRIDNPWLPLAPGRRWTYRVERDAGPGGTLVVEVAGTRRVAGVEATVVTETRRGRAASRGERRLERWYAQDTAGNVWLLGESGRWEAGVDGARAGLAMPATPRLGDGWERMDAPGVAQDRSRVVAIDATVDVPAGSYDAVLELERTTPLEPGQVLEVSHVAGVGEVLREEPGGSAELLAHTG